MELMKNGLSKPAILRISQAFNQLDNSFDSTSFEKSALTNIENLELKQRVEHIIKALHLHLPEDFNEALSLMLQIKSVWNYGDPDDALSGFAAWPIIDYIAAYGLEYPKQSLEALKYLTELFSAEFAIRAFIQRYPLLCHQYFLNWIHDKDEHIRRLVSEGTRPRLPWGVQLKCFVKDPTINIELLDVLSKDESLYVRRSVANHLNDIAKDHPKIVIDICTKWFETKSKDMTWLITHATRTLIKSGYPEVFPLLGYCKEPKVNCSNILLSQKQLFVGENINFSFEITSKSTAKQKLVIDYALHFVKSNGETKAKVFKIKNLTLNKNESIKIEKSFSFKAISTRKYYEGTHKIEILLNGNPIQNVCFFVKNKFKP
ncbi:MAG: DNA alkylation repair protein [Colwelliaceae bacterium]|nr:DNA alkylation repair protein [Colwelliaceae bacterium]